MSAHDPNTPAPLHRPNPYNLFPDLAPDADGPVAVNYVTDPATACVQCLRRHGCLDDEDELRMRRTELGTSWPVLRIFP